MFLSEDDLLWGSNNWKRAKRYRKRNALGSDKNKSYLACQIFSDILCLSDKIKRKEYEDFRVVTSYNWKPASDW